ncbi:hypothetical protein KSC_069750 [Ktedonobacter sp. SOSP1-52]|uniref:hypothetical protein n=1 Tax=Ktedonobacter sp. SOSP1-52 TaxID=2778366 RepID=UPI001A2641D0|nr:hypothetical protein [Ktedonobacter sp. SOSP1-52]GHO68083.1 hypothetical protein KSC_069750 [Ktedonobacter sp. SOSP1-52]
MTDLLLPAWYRAVQVPGRSAQQALFATLEKIVATINLTLTVNTYMVGGNYYIIVFCLGAIAPPAQKAMGEPKAR